MFEQLLLRLQLDITSLTNKLRQVFGADLVQAQAVSLVLPAGAVLATAPHALGRAYKGAIIVGMSPPVAGVQVAPPGTNSARLVTVAAASAPAADVTINLRVF